MKKTCLRQMLFLRPAHLTERENKYNIMKKQIIRKSLTENDGFKRSVSERTRKAEMGSQAGNPIPLPRAAESFD